MWLLEKVVNYSLDFEVAFVLSSIILDPNVLHPPLLI